MPTALDFSMRCQSKNLLASMDPNGEHSLSVALQTVPPAMGMPGPYTYQQSTLNLTVTATDDTFLIGNMYTVSVTEEVAAP